MKAEAMGENNRGFMCNTKSIFFRIPSVQLFWKKLNDWKNTQLLYSDKSTLERLYERI